MPLRSNFLVLLLVLTSPPASANIQVYATQRRRLQRKPKLVVILKRTALAQPLLLRPPIPGGGAFPSLLRNASDGPQINRWHCLRVTD